MHFSFLPCGLRDLRTESSSDFAILVEVQIMKLVIIISSLKNDKIQGWNCYEPSRSYESILIHSHMYDINFFFSI